MKSLRILIADDHELVRRGTRQLLLTRSDWKIVAEASSGREAIEKAKKHKPTIAILDLGMPDMDGLEVTRQLRKEVPEAGVIILTMHDSILMVQRALESGASGYVLKSDLTKYLVKAVQKVSQGKQFLTPQVSDIALRDCVTNKATANSNTKPGMQPSQRELEVIRLLAEGKSNKEIGLELGIATRTVETHRARILSKLDIHSVAQLIHYAIRHRIIPIPPSRPNEPQVVNGSQELQKP